MRLVSDCPYFNVSAKVEDIKTKNKVLYVINESDYKKAKNIDSIKMLDDLNINDLVCFIKYDINHSMVDIDKLEESIKIFNKALRKGFKEGFKNRLIKQVIVFYPFIRFSNDFICTFFTLIEFFDGEKIFSIIEAIPGYDVIVKDYNSLVSYIDTAFFSVRNSTHIESSIFSYGNYTENLNAVNTNQIVINYILNNFIMNNFGLDFTNLKCKIGILTNREITMNNNIKKSSIKNTYLDGGIYTVSLDRKAYDDYMRIGLESILQTSLIIYSIDKLLIISHLENSNKFINKRMKLLARFINNTHKKLNVRLDYDLMKVIEDDYIGEDKEKLIYILSRGLGEFIGGLLESRNI
jgi:hypothetical protein